ncbi:MAG: NAD(P)/FAD-dependent oxidoreductase [Acidobacteria bacterium]|nr:NAD(P)/FAD-dependent oxidoreductase [Acidobacteriota bacterium]
MDYDIIIIGSGPAGYIAAVRAGQLGMRAALVEKGEIGGMCMHWGCVAVKAMMESARYFVRLRVAERFGIRGVRPEACVFDWSAAAARAANIGQRLSSGVRATLDKHKVDVLRGEAALVTPQSVRVDNRIVTAGTLVVATGSRPERRPLPVPEEMVLEIDALWRLEALPTRLAVAGEGPNALEIAQILRMVGKDVTLLVPGPTALPFFDPFFAQYAARLLEQHGIRVVNEARVEGVAEGGLRVSGTVVPADRLVNAHFRKAVLPPCEFPLDTRDGFLVTDDAYRTSQPTVYAVGDVNGRRMLAHAASAQGLHAVGRIAGVREDAKENQVPLCVYTSPEMAQVGQDEPRLQLAGVDYRVDEFPLTANAKALAEGNAEGVIRLLSSRLYGEVLGVQIVAPHATDLISEAAAILAMEGTLYDMVRIVHAHPTVSEVFMDVGFAALDRAVRE